MESGRIYEQLKKRIIWLDLGPGNVLNISQLAHSFEVSRTPIKEALLVLQGEGWVLRDGSHFLITELSLSRIKEISEIRNILEVQGNLLAMERITSKEIFNLHKISEKIGALDPESSNKRIMKLDAMFHRTLYKAARNNQLYQILDGLLSQYLRFWLSNTLRVSPQAFFYETVEIISAIEEKNKDRLRMAIINHLKMSVNEIIRTY